MLPCMWFYFAIDFFFALVCWGFIAERERIKKKCRGRPLKTWREITLVLELVDHFSLKWVLACMHFACRATLLSSRGSERGGDISNILPNFSDFFFVASLIVWSVCHRETREVKMIFSVSHTHTGDWKNEIIDRPLFSPSLLRQRRLSPCGATPKEAKKFPEFSLWQVYSIAPICGLRPQIGACAGG